MMKKAVLLCFVLFAVISVTTATQCKKQIHVCRDKIDNNTYKPGENWVNSKCQFCTCLPRAMRCCMGKRDAAGKCKLE
ncbi:hypothetical protein Q7C36_012287 [Tachysurus vachellii]|uniref:Uncharacterized protein n=1 Tax=Tachysurus vachellii TaxID=175792 RepID=A0AA88SRM6_TACVA|nr:hypothetical protein Q7C36_012287 [Tachysurus vachellii]